MLSLPELQHRFARAIRDEECDAADEGCQLVASSGQINEADRIAVYRNNWREGFLKALAAGFPVIARLVGTDYFRQLGLEFLAAHPSRSGDLEHIGAPFAGFLERRHATTEFAYLADVAALEWACQQVLQAADPIAASVDLLRTAEPSACAALRFRLHPAARLVSSAYPISRIWLSNQAQAEPEVIDLRYGPEQLLVRCLPAGLELHRLRAGEFALARAFEHGAELGDALAVAQQQVPDTDLATALHRLFDCGALNLA